MSLDATVRQMKDVGVLGVAIVSRDGTVLASDLPPGVSRETFSIMCATIHGAGMTVSNELKRSNPRTISLESADGHIVITEAGRRALIVYVLSAELDWTALGARLAPLAEQVARDTG